MSKLSNTLMMIELLQSGRKYSVKELASILEVSDRMIRIYKEDLEKAGIYIDVMMGPYGGYVLKQNVHLPLRKISEEDAMLLKRYIDIESDFKYKEKLLTLYNKIIGINKSYDAKEVLSLKDEDNKKYNCIAKAIKEKRKLKILYYSYDKGENERIIYPAQLFLFQDGWYCAAFCEKRNDFRHFELKRILKYILLDEKYE